jgi:hypothetical protein
MTVIVSGFLDIVAYAFARLKLVGTGCLVCDLLDDDAPLSGSMIPVLLFLEK